MLPAPDMGAGARQIPGGVDHAAAALVLRFRRISINARWRLTMRGSLPLISPAC